MADAYCTVDHVGSTVYALATEYIDEVERAAEDDVRDCAQMVVDDLHGSSPSMTGKYAGGWAMEPDADNSIGSAYRIYNRKKPGLTHLLEHGHGGPAPAPAHPHIAAAAQAGISELERRMSG